MLCKQCSTEMLYCSTVEKSDQLYHFYSCTGCGKPTHYITYKYNPADCPKHHWEHMGTEFIDDPHKHQINHVMRCDRCGAVHRIPRDTYGAGISGRVEIDHPKVESQLLWNRTVFGMIDRDVRGIGRGREEIPQEAQLPSEAEI